MRSEEERTSSRSLRAAVVPAVVAAALAAAPGALADIAQSSNWAGYAAHRSGVRFRQVSGTWKQPNAVCRAGIPTFASAWVGLGGFRESAKALEQIGSEVDCNARGKVVSSIWYELVPAPSHTVGVKVHPGDVLSASVTVVGHSVTLAVHDLTRHRAFTHTAHVSRTDVSSAEWIVEAPTQCQRASFCRLLPLADFGLTTFTRARAVTTTGHAGSISDRGWDATRITLASRAHHFVGSMGAPAGAAASPSRLSAGGRSFTVTYAMASPTGSVSVAPARSAASMRLVPPNRPTTRLRRLAVAGMVSAPSMTRLRRLAVEGTTAVSATTRLRNVRGADTEVSVAHPPALRHIAAALAILD